MKKYGNFNPFSIRTEGHISKKSIENFHPNRRTFLKKVWKKDAINNPFSIRTEGHINRKSITFLNFPSKLKDFFEKSIEKGGKFQSFFDQNRRTYKRKKYILFQYLTEGPHHWGKLMLKYPWTGMKSWALNIENVVYIII